MPQVYLERSVALSSGLLQCTRPIVFIAADVALVTITAAARAPFGGIVGNMLGRIISVSVVLAVVVLLAILQTTTPSTAGPIGILFVFIFIYMLVLGVLTFLLFWGSKLISKLLQLATQKAPRRPLSLIRSYYFSSILALAPVIFMGMQSVGEVGFYDVILVLLFVGVGCFYVAKRTA